MIRTQMNTFDKCMIHLGLRQKIHGNTRWKKNIAVIVIVGMLVMLFCVAVAYKLVVRTNQMDQPDGPGPSRWIRTSQMDQRQPDGPNRQKCLIIILGQARAAELTWPSFKEMLLDPTGCDLALSVGSHEEGDVAENPFYSSAKYQWIWNETQFGNVSDSETWDLSFDSLHATAVQQDPDLKSGDEWKKLYEIPWTWIGPVSGQPGSAGILLFMRLWAHLKMQELGLYQKYSYIMYTRSDYLYRCPFPFEELTRNRTDKHTMWITKGEDYDGITDRNLLTTSALMSNSLDILMTMFKDHQQWFDTMKDAMRGPGWHLERVIKQHLEFKGLLGNVSRYDPVMFTVRGKDTWTRWRKGRYDAELGMFVKYQAEKDKTDENCGVKK